MFLSLIAVAATLLVIAPVASGAPPQNAPNPGPTSGGQTAALQPPPSKKSSVNGNCSAGAVALNALNPFSHCNLASQAAGELGQLPGAAVGLAGSAAKGLAGDVMDQVSSWMVQAAQTVDGDVMNATSTSTPELSAQWYEQEFAYLAFFGAALAGIVALLGLVSASVRGDPHALGEIFYGILRAGLITAMVVSLTLLALRVADGISSNVAQHMPRLFFQTLASAWGANGWGGLGSSALAFIAALVEVFVAVLLWIELLFRDAAIYVAVLFFPFTLAMAIWPRLSAAHSKLVRVLGIFIAFKPVALVIMMTGANLLLGGVSFYGGLGPSVGTILAGLAVLAMAAFAPWALIHLAGMDVGVMGSSASRRRDDSVRSGSVEDTLGGELYGGAITFGGGGGAAAAAAGGGAGAMTAASGGRGGVLAGGSRGDRSATSGGGSHSSNGSGGSVGFGGGRQMLPGPLAAAAGLLPAGWQVTQSIAARGQWLTDHGAARVHTAAGHGGLQPSSLRSGNSSSGSRSSQGQGGEGPPPPPPVDPQPQIGRDGGGPVVGGGGEPSAATGGGETGSPRPTTPRADQTIPPPTADQLSVAPAPDQPFRARREER